MAYPSSALYGIPSGEKMTDTPRSREYRERVLKDCQVAQDLTVRSGVRRYGEVYVVAFRELAGDEVEDDAGDSTRLSSGVGIRGGHGGIGASGL